MAIDNTQTNNSVHGELSSFVDRRVSGQERKKAGFERRQFTNSYEGLSPEAADLGRAIDAYKLANRRRFINYEEMLTILKQLGYQRS